MLITYNSTGKLQYSVSSNSQEANVLQSKEKQQH